MKNFKVTPYFKRISKGNSALEKQYIPDEREDLIKDYETSDPLDEKKHMVTNRLIHRYKDRVLFLVTDKCALVCRHCFRRDFIQSNSNEFTNRDLEDACAYLGDNPNVHEILLSGGDPLTLKPARLEYLLSKIKECRPDIIIRIGTRVPIVDPEKITIEVTDILKKAAPVWLSLQCNHPDELTNEVKIATSLLNQSGIHLLNQSVLLKDINDSLPVLKKLSHKLVDFNIKPYYIFQGDLAKGTSHFRVPISKGLLLMKELRSEVSGIAMPLYAVDIPSGGGKIPLNMDYIDKIDNDFYYLKNSSGFVGKYPREEL